MTPTAKAKKLKASREDRAYQRSVSSSFRQKEQEARDRYNEFGKMARQFAKAYPREFLEFKKGRSVASQPIQAARHMPVTTAPRMPATMPATNENGSPKAPAAVDLIALLGLARD